MGDRDEAPPQGLGGYRRARLGVTVVGCRHRVSGLEVRG
jgi:hypothetical protein